ncbi:hypothetical protein K8I61_18225 [bacterium]|nr:hypothetical protein [bacterium]
MITRIRRRRAEAFALFITVALFAGGCFSTDDNEAGNAGFIATDAEENAADADGDAELDDDADEDAGSPATLDEIDEDTIGEFRVTVYTHTFPERLDDTATGAFERPAYAYDAIPVDAKYTHVLSFQMSPMMPPLMDATPSNGPIVLYSDEMDVIVFSPMDAFFASVVNFREGALISGVAGEVRGIKRDFAHRFVLVEGRGLRATIDAWGDVMRADRGKARPDRYADAGVGTIGYWTDNGAAYYYDTAPGMNEQDTLLAVKDEADDLGIPYGYFQLDSWWYPKEPGVLSPGGLIRWEPIEEMFPDGLTAFQEELGLPLVLHNRWFALENDYIDDHLFVFDPPMALPLERDVYDIFMENARAWGAITYEQDWLMSQYLGVARLRDNTDFGAKWMRHIDRAAKAKGLSTQLCMPGAAHLMSAVDMKTPTSIRTSIDYRKNVSKESYWPQFHIVNLLAHAIGVWPYKDNFWSSEDHGQAEALISALSAGMVGPGDPLGAVDVGIVMSTCRADGVLLKPDRPAYPIDAMFLDHARPFITTTHSRRAEATWRYVAAYHLAAEHPQRSLFDRVWSFVSYGLKDVAGQFVFPDHVTDWSLDLATEIGATGDVVLYDWRTARTRVVSGEIFFERFAALYDFAYLVAAPISDNGLALIGEPDKFVTVADRRFIDIDTTEDAIRVALAGAPGEVVTLRAYDANANALLPDLTATIGADGKGFATIER